LTLLLTYHIDFHTPIRSFVQQNKKVNDYRYVQAKSIHIYVSSHPNDKLDTSPYSHQHYLHVYNR